MNKLLPKWEGTYRMVHISLVGSVHLETKDDVPVSNSWNIEHLCKYHLHRFYP